MKLSATSVCNCNETVCDPRLLVHGVTVGVFILLAIAWLPFIPNAGLIDTEQMMYTYFRQCPTAFELSAFPILRSVMFRPTLEIILRLEYAALGLSPHWFLINNFVVFIGVMLLLLRFTVLLFGSRIIIAVPLTLTGLNYFNYELLGWHQIIADTLAGGCLLLVPILFTSNTWRSFLLSLFILLFGIGAKETAFLTPAVVWGVYWLVRDRYPITRPTLKIAGYCTLVAVYGAYYFTFGNNAMLGQEWGYYSDLQGLIETPSGVSRYLTNLTNGLISLCNSICLDKSRTILSPFAVVPLMLLLLGMRGFNRCTVLFGLLMMMFSLVPFGTCNLSMESTDRYLFPANLWLAISLAASLPQIAACLRLGRSSHLTELLITFGCLLWGVGAIRMITITDSTFAYSRGYRDAARQISRLNQQFPKETIYLNQQLTPVFTDQKGHLVHPDQYCSIFLERYKFITYPDMAVLPIVTAEPGPNDWVIVRRDMIGDSSPAVFRIAHIDFSLVRAGEITPPIKPLPTSATAQVAQ